MKHVEVRTGLYRDSVRLMQISSALTAEPDIEQALIAMATGLNLELLAGMGFDVPAATGPNDMLIALRTADDTAMIRALQRLDTELTSTTRAANAGYGEVTARFGEFATGPVGFRHRSTGAAALSVDGPRVALVSTPGRYAFVEAMDALDAGVSVMIFSDNVPVDQEVRLKEAAAQRDLLVLGPDCGTAVIGGVGLGFANVVRPGSVGLVAASGTGAQQVMSLLAAAGVGISHCLGVGGRDLSNVVQGRSTHAALDALDADAGTEVIVVISKPPAASVADAIREHAARLGTPVHFATLGPDQPDLTMVVDGLLRQLDVPVPSWPSWPGATGRPDTAGTVGAAGTVGTAGGSLRGLFSGGTLCVESMTIAARTLGAIGSNVALHPEWSVANLEHTMVDLGDDEYTVGRPHPMIDYGPRIGLIAKEAADSRCRVILLDVVLGHGAHPDPAAQLASAIRSALAERTTPLSIVVSLIGTPDDPQDLTRQAEALTAAGASCYLSNAAATHHAVRIASGG